MGRTWELYDVETDRTEQNNLASTRPEKVKELSDLYDAWAKRCNVVPFDQLPRERRIISADGVTAKAQNQHSDD